VAASGSTFASATTDASGGYELETVPDGSYFVYVEPTDGEHLPGGSLCRHSTSADSLRGSTSDIVLSSSPPGHAVYVGMSTCLICHTEYATEKTLAHRLGFRVPGVSSGLQDTSEHPEIDEGLEYFVEAADYTGGTPVYHYDYDGTRGLDKFQTSLTDPTGAGGVVYAILWLWQDSATGEHKITIENVGNVTDPGNFAERVVQLTYGGAIHKQRYMIDWPDRNGLYPILQFQSEGNEARYDRTRQVFRDYHLDFYWNTNGTAGDPADDLIKAPDATKNISLNCIGCHAPDYRQYTDGSTGEVLCTTREDPNGEYDIDGDGLLNDLNVGCENCHGPGSIHVSVQEPRYIVSPEYLSPSRDVQLCARCHDRQTGADAIGNDHPLNADGEFPRPGISRGEYLAEFVDRKGPAASDFWADFEHSKSHHQQGPDFIKSKHYRNEHRLMTCSSCHDMHGGTGFERGLVADPDAPDSALCLDCHGRFLGGTGEHTMEVLGVGHGPALATCVDCHMAKTAKSGSGHYGLLLGTPDGTAADAAITYFENDIASHVFDVPRKTNAGVSGVEPASAMPIPYTNSCGTVTGTVTNGASSGAPLAGVTVSVSPNPSGATYTTNAAGVYTAGLTIGSYALTFSADGFEDYETSVVVVAASTTTIDVELEATSPVRVSISGAPSSPSPGAAFDLTAEVTALDGSTVQGYSWTQTHSAEATIENATSATAGITLGDVEEYKAALLEELDAPSRWQVLGIDPFALEEGGAVTFECEVTTSSGTYTAEVEVHTTLGFAAVSTGLCNVPLGLPVLLGSRAQASYSWVLTPPGGSSATLEDEDTANPWFVPDTAGLYSATVFDLDEGSDPHNVGTTSGDGNDVPMRVDGDSPPLLGGFTAHDIGHGAMCIVCHNTRRGAANDETGLPSLTAYDTTPHVGAQGDVFMGQNCFFVTVGLRSGHSYIENTCTQCHMQITPPPADLSYQLSGTNHTFAADTAICSDCHGNFSADSLIAANDAALLEYEEAIAEAIAAEIAFQTGAPNNDTVRLSGTVGGVDTDIDVDATTVVGTVVVTESHGRAAMNIVLDGALLEGVRLASGTELLGAGGNLLDNAVAGNSGEILAKCVWNFFMLENDASHGIHNPGFFTNVIVNSTDVILATWP